MSRLLADPDRDRALREKGFTTAALLAAGEAEQLLEALLALRPDAAEPTDRAMPGFACHSSFLHPDEAYRRAACVIVEEALGPRLDALLVGYRRLIAGFLVKPAGTGEVPLHRDWTMTANADAVALSIWCPLADVEEANGALAFVPGSHRMAGGIETPNRPARWHEVAARLKGDAVPAPLRAGEAAIYDSRTLHWSHPNRARAIRPVATATYIPAAEIPVFYSVGPGARDGRAEAIDMSGDLYLAQDPADWFRGAVCGPRFANRGDSRPAGLVGRVRAVLGRG